MLKRECMKHCEYMKHCKPTYQPKLLRVCAQEAYRSWAQWHLL